jgi:hypothetical protein
MCVCVCVCVCVRKMNIDELNGKPHPNLIEKFKFEPNLIVSKPELEPKPCDLDSLMEEEENENNLSYAKGYGIMECMGYKGEGHLGKFEQGPSRVPKILERPKGLGLGPALNTPTTNNSNL